MRPWRSTLDARLVWGSIGVARLANWRVTRAELRVATGASGTQLKVHLARLAEMEYLLVYLALEVRTTRTSCCRTEPARTAKIVGRGRT